MDNKHFMKKYDSLIFDLDGTLWDTLNITTNELQKISDKYNENTITEDIVKEGMGKTFDEVTKLYFKNLNKQKREKYTIEAFNNITNYLFEHGGNIYPNTEDTIKTLSKHFKLFIVSNTESDNYIKAFLQSSKLYKYFTDYQSNEHTNTKKEENIKILIQRNNLKNPIYIGDTNTDKLSAESVGIPFIYAAYGFGTINNNDKKINKIDDLISILLINNN